MGKSSSRCVLCSSAYYYSISEPWTSLVSNNLTRLKSLLGNNQTSETVNSRVMWVHNELKCIECVCAYSLHFHFLLGNNKTKSTNGKTCPSILKKTAKSKLMVTPCKYQKWQYLHCSQWMVPAAAAVVECCSEEFPR